MYVCIFFFFLTETLVTSGNYLSLKCPRTERLLVADPKVGVTISDTHTNTHTRARTS